MRTARWVPLRRAAAPAATLAFALLASMLVGDAAPAATACPSPPAVFPQTSLTSGTLATGLTTISGEAPTSFDVQILGVIPDGIVLGIDAIVARITGPPAFLQQTGGGFSGMSGSPVSIGGRLVGVVSYGYYADPAVIGLTPGSAMVDLLGFLDGGRAARTIAFTPQVRRAVAQTIPAGPAQLTGGLEALPVPVGVSGLPERSLRRLQDRLDRHALGVQLFASGSAAAPAGAATTRFVPGQPIGSVISYGDATIWAMGTASIVCGDVVAAYGHSLFGGPPGPVTLGMTGADVLTVMKGSPYSLPSTLGYVTDTRGTFTQDRYAGQVGTFGTLPPTAAITSHLSSPDTGISRDGRTDVAFQQDYWFVDAAWSHFYGNTASVFQRYGRGTSNLSWTIRGATEEGTPFTVENRGMFWSDYDAASTVNKLTSSVYELAFNRFTRVTFTSVEATGSITGDRLEGRISRIRTRTSLQPALRSRSLVRVRPGGKISVEVTLAPADGIGSDHVARFSLRVPRSARGLRRVELAGGRDRPYPPARGAGTFEDLVRALSGGSHRNDLLVSGFDRSVFAQDVIVTGHGSFTVRVVR